MALPSVMRASPPPAIPKSLGQGMFSAGANQPYLGQNPLSVLYPSLAPQLLNKQTGPKTPGVIQPPSVQGTSPQATPFTPNFMPGSPQVGNSTIMPGSPTAVTGTSTMGTTGPQNSVSTVMAAPQTTPGGSPEMPPRNPVGPRSGVLTGIPPKPPSSFSTPGSGSISGNLTSPNTFLGTVPYAAPEQFPGGPAAWGQGLRPEFQNMPVPGVLDSVPPIRTPPSMIEFENRFIPGGYNGPNGSGGGSQHGSGVGTQIGGDGAPITVPGGGGMTVPNGGGGGVNQPRTNIPRTPTIMNPYMPVGGNGPQPPVAPGGGGGLLGNILKKLPLIGVGIGGITGGIDGYNGSGGSLGGTGLGVGLGIGHSLIPGSGGTGTPPGSLGIGGPVPPRYQPRVPMNPYQPLFTGQVPGTYPPPQTAIPPLSPEGQLYPDVPPMYSQPRIRR